MILTFEQKDTKGAHVFQNMEDRLKKGVYINKLAEIIYPCQRTTLIGILQFPFFDILLYFSNYLLPIVIIFE